ncbi:TetR/AcrR family transcriptional regulator [Actinomadura sp. ATCC 31491]|uniref:TetR/AcrR family transcriptional regulator n=1 Tax=Actinomadura luzonensis TaxID=2805427 RepID=A0ABT0G1W0_9ACTN|nr:TetR/AcrR family transcriptional regulator [Actinomadura luzonensis]MCK2218560.1 TetR/AcrR family transcriptional regulator [Actinomadura luzonensis]
MTPSYSPGDGPSRPGGPARRRPRLTDEETARRMLDTALAMVHRDGLTVGLDHLGFEDVIRDAGVSRAAVYRRWPYKDLFFGDLLRELAGGAAPAAAPALETTREVLDAVLAAHAGDLATPEGRHDLVTELLRATAVSDFEAVHGSPEWRTYLALQATFLSLPEGDLRADVQAALARSEQRFVERVARGWEAVATALGYRPRPGTGFPVIATLACAAMRGLVLMTLSDPGLLDRRVPANPTAASAAADWSLLGLAAAALAVAYLEPDPDVTWDEARLAALTRTS